MGSLTRVGLRRIYLDTNAVVAMAEVPRSPLLGLLGQSDRLVLITSEFTLLEALVKPIQGLVDRTPVEEDPEARRREQWFTTQVSAESEVFAVKPVTREVLIHAALLRAHSASLKTPDAIHVSTALTTACEIFMTGDDRLSQQMRRVSRWASAPGFTFAGLAEDDVARVLAP